MKPLTIKELKALEAGDWVWIVNEENNNNYYVLITAKSRKVFAVMTALAKDFYVHHYCDYGTKWIAYKNKEQAECKGEIVELPCELGQLLYAVYDENIHEYFCEEINVHEDGRFIFETPTLFPKRLTFGEDIFTDKSEAERRLAELKGE